MLSCLFMALLSSLQASALASSAADTSHVPAFTENLNNPDAKDHVSGGKVVAAFKGGSPDIPESANRVENYAKR